MSMHQYIGARYVPYYYENSLDPTSTEWEPNVNYEALTVVTLPNQHSYISKKSVPASVGSPALNPDYWLDTGSDNAYIAQLQQDLGDVATLTTTDKDSAVDAINELNSEVQPLITDVNILNKKVNRGDLVILTDSYGNVADNFTTFLSGLGIDDIYDNVYIKATSSDGGFYTGQWVNDILSIVVGDTAKVKDVLLVGGTNDAKQNASTAASVVTTNIGTFFTNLKGRFSNIENAYYLYCPHVKKSNYTGVNVHTMFRAASAAFIDTDVNTHFVNGCLIYNSFTETLSDNMHPNAAGSKRIANACLSILKGSEIAYPTFSGGHTFTGGNIIVQCYKDTVTAIVSFNGDIANLSGQSITKFNLAEPFLIPMRLNSDSSMNYFWLKADGSTDMFPSGLSGNVQCYFVITLPSSYLAY